MYLIPIGPFTIFSWRQVTFEQVTSSDRTPLSRMLPRVIGVEFCIEPGYCLARALPGLVSWSYRHQSALGTKPIAKCFYAHLAMPIPARDLLLDIFFDFSSRPRRKARR
jgi:hypothetical protein